MRSFEVSHLGSAEFVDKIKSRLATREYDKYVSIHLNGADLAVELRWLGTPRFDYRISAMGEGFRAELIQQRVAPLHAAFGDRFEAYFEEALVKAGARVV